MVWRRAPPDCRIYTVYIWPGMTLWLPEFLYGD